MFKIYSNGREHIKSFKHDVKEFSNYYSNYNYLVN